MALADAEGLILGCSHSAPANGLLFIFRKKRVKKKKQTMFLTVAKHLLLFNLFKITRTVIEIETSSSVPCFGLLSYM